MPRHATYRRTIRATYRVGHTVSAGRGRHKTRVRAYVNSLFKTELVRNLGWRGIDDLDWPWPSTSAGHDHRLGELG